MFTGLIESTGRIERIEPAAAGRRMWIATPNALALSSGDSVSVSGVCLTVTEAGARGFATDVSPETLRVTTLGEATPGRLVNLERPLRADGRLGGHFVLGHVDGVGRVRDLRPDGEARWLTVDVPEALAALLIPKGSIAIDGISLTIAALDGGRVSVQIVPFTWEHTTLSAAQAGDRVNIEGDVIGKYVARLVAPALPTTVASGKGGRG